MYDWMVYVWCIIESWHHWMVSQRLSFKHWHLVLQKCGFMFVFINYGCVLFKLWSVFPLEDCYLFGCVHHAVCEQTSCWTSILSTGIYDSLIGVLPCFSIWNYCRIVSENHYLKLVDWRCLCWAKLFVIAVLAENMLCHAELVGRCPFLYLNMKDVNSRLSLFFLKEKSVTAQWLAIALFVEKYVSHWPNSRLLLFLFKKDASHWPNSRLSLFLLKKISVTGQIVGYCFFCWKTMPVTGQIVGYPFFCWKRCQSLTK